MKVIKKKCMKTERTLGEHNLCQPKKRGELKEKLQKGQLWSYIKTQLTIGFSN